MIIFHNPGLIEPNAFRLSGASVKKEGSFGRFGTGLKYAVAAILRMQGTITVHSGNRNFTFELETSVLKEVCFSEVVLVEEQPAGCDVRTPLGFTVDLGKDWEPWMAVRELGCNARDEGGDFACCEPESVESFMIGDPLRSDVDETFILVDWAKVEGNWAEIRASTFVPDDAPVLLEERGVRVLAGESRYLYHRGVRVMKLPKPSLFTYDIVGPVELTEDRTVRYGFCVEADVRNTILLTEDRPLIAAAVTARESYWEGSFDWAGKQWGATVPGSAWLEEVSVIRGKDNCFLSKSAGEIFLSHSAYKTATSYAGGSYDSPTGTFGEAAEELSELGFDLAEVNTFVTDELPGEATSTIKGGSVYVTRTLVEKGSRLEIARVMLRRFLELKSGGSHDKLLDLIVPLILDQSYDLKNEREISEAREEGLRPSMVESFFGLHPIVAPPELIAAGEADF